MGAPVGDDRAFAGWAGDEGRFWAENRDRQEAMLARLSRRLIELASIQPCESVLDIGCGCGETTVRAAAAARPGAVVGIDVSDAMLECAKELAVTGGADNVSFQRADAQSQRFTPRSFDVAISQLGVMFFRDPQEAFANIHRALRPGGRLAFLCWQGFDRNEHIALPLQVRATALNLQLTGTSGQAGPFSLADPAQIRRLLGSVGFNSIRVEAVEERLCLGADVEEALGFYQARPEARNFTASVPAELAERIGEAMRAALEARESPRGVFVDSAAWLVSARS